MLKRNNFLKEKKSSGSKLIQFLLKICFLPIQCKVKDDKLNVFVFSIWSKKFWIHICVYIIPFFFTNFYIFYYFITANVMGQLVAKYSFVENLSVLSTYVSHLSAVFPLLLRYHSFVKNINACET